MLFETGYGPSGLPHIGTFGEVARTTMVRHAFEILTEGRVPTRLLCFSDDMDGLRKVPDNVPNKAMLADYVELRDAASGAIVRNPTPLTSVPDPFGKIESFGHHNNAMLRAFLDRFGFDYEFASSTDYYRGGRFDETLLGSWSATSEVRDDRAAAARAEDGGRPIARSCRSSRNGTATSCARCRIARIARRARPRDAIF